MPRWKETSVSFDIKVFMMAQISVVRGETFRVPIDFFNTFFLFCSIDRFDRSGKFISKEISIQTTWDVFPVSKMRFQFLRWRIFLSRTGFERWKLTSGKLSTHDEDAALRDCTVSSMVGFSRDNSYIRGSWPPAKASLFSNFIFLLKLGFWEILLSLYRLILESTLIHTVLLKTYTWYLSSIYFYCFWYL